MLDFAIFCSLPPKIATSDLAFRQDCAAGSHLSKKKHAEFSGITEKNPLAIIKSKAELPRSMR